MKRFSKFPGAFRGLWF